MCSTPWSHSLQHSQYAVSKFGENVLVFSCADKSLFIIDGRTSFTTSSFFVVMFSQICLGIERKKNAAANEFGHFAHKSINTSNNTKK